MDPESGSLTGGGSLGLRTRTRTPKKNIRTFVDCFSPNRISVIQLDSVCCQRRLFVNQLAVELNLTGGPTA
eukprot:4976907-Amphidinium_carterae.1